MRDSVLVLDLGSSRLRCAVVPLEGARGSEWRGEPAEAASAPYPAMSARAGALAQAFNPRLLRERLLRVLAQGAQAAGPRSVRAVAVTAQRGAACFLDARLNTLSASPNTDVRAVFQGSAIDEAHRAEIHRTTGRLPSLLFVPAKLAWLRENRPRIAERAAKAAGLDAWAALQLTGALAETAGGLAEMGLLDVASGAPAVALMRRLGVSPEILPPIIPRGAAVGRLTPEAADATGLPRTVAVHLAGPDAQAAALGCGAVEPGAAAVCAGWSAPAQVATAAPAFDLQRRTWTTLHSLPGVWAVEANPGDAGRTLDAVRRLVAPRASAARFAAMAAQAPADAPPIAAFLGPRALDLSNPGMTMGGFLLPAPVTQEGLDAPAFARAAFENAAFAVCESVALARSVAGAAADSAAISGGMTENALFPQLVADVLGEPVSVHRNATAAGAAALAASHPDALPARAAAFAAQGRRVEPSHRGHERREAYRRWLRLRERMDAMADEL